MNTLSIVASFGALVWIFQDGNLSALLGFQPLGFVETTQPVILFCVLFGLSMDYEVFLLSRMKEVWDRTGDNQEAVARGLERSGRIVTSAALIVVVVAGSFAFADIVLIKALGIGMAIAVALDATVVRALLVPATMRLLGRWNWWLPSGLRRVPRIETAGIAGLLMVLVAAGSLLTACTASTAPILANPPAPHPAPPSLSPAPSIPTDPQPVVLPRDDAPHDRLTEWWYYTGHVAAADGHRFGFEFVVFRAERGGFPVTWASHLALTDETAATFRFAQRTEIGPQVDRSPPNAFELLDRARASGVRRIAIPGVPARALDDARWQRPRRAGRNRCRRCDEPFAGAVRHRPPTDRTKAARSARRDRVDRLRRRWFVLLLLADVHGGRRQRHARQPAHRGDRRGLVRPPVGRLHHRRRWRLGLVRSQSRGRHGPDPVTRAQRGRDVPAHLRDPGRLHGPDCASVARRILGRGDWPLDEPATGATYPAGWRVAIPGDDLAIQLTPAVADQELDTRASTGVIYWEGSQRVAATRAGRALGGEAYVELTGYASTLSGSAPGGSAAPGGSGGPVALPPSG